MVTAVEQDQRIAERGRRWRFVDSLRFSASSVVKESAESVQSVDVRLFIQRGANASGSAYSATINFTGTDNASLIDQCFSGSVFGNGSGSPTADGSQYAWNILYQSDALNPVAATYNTPNGVLNPGQDSMLAPNPGMQMAGLGAYSQPQGFWGFYAQHEQAIDTTAGITLGLAAGLATGGLAELALGAAFGTELGFWGGAAASITSNAAAGFAAGTVQGLASGENTGQSLEQGGISAAFGGGFGAAPGLFALGRIGVALTGDTLASAAGVGGDYMTNFIRAWRMYPGSGAMYTPSLGGAAQQTLDRLAYAMGRAGNTDGPSALALHNAYLKFVRPGALGQSFNPEWAVGRWGARIYDDFDQASGTGFEANTTPWSQLRAENPTDMALISRKLGQVGADFELLSRPGSGVNSVIWFGTEALPTIGPAAQIRGALSQAGIEYYVVPPPEVLP